MDERALRAICRLFDLGEPAGAASPVAGGLTHRMWRIATTRGAFAVKEVNRDFENVEYVGSFERAFVFEQAAYHAGLPMPRPVPVAATGRCLAEVPATGARPMTVRAHAWVEGEPLGNSRVYPPEDAAQVAVMLARIHALGLTADRASAGPRAFGDAHWRAHLRRADERGDEWAPLLRTLLPAVGELEAYVASACNDPTPLLLSHNDADKKNCLRAPDGRLLLVDWDAGGPVNPRHDVANCALVWAGVRLGDPDAALARTFVGAYRRAGGGDMRFRREDLAELVSRQLVWFNFNVRRALDERARDDADRAAGVAALYANARQLPRFLRSLDAWLSVLQA